MKLHVKNIVFSLFFLPFNTATMHPTNKKEMQLTHNKIMNDTIEYDVIIDRKANKAIQKMNNAWNKFDPNQRIKLSKETYALIQNTFSTKNIPATETESPDIIEISRKLEELEKVIAQEEQEKIKALKELHKKKEMVNNLLIRLENQQNNLSPKKNTTPQKKAPQKKSQTETSTQSQPIKQKQTPSTVKKEKSPFAQIHAARKKMFSDSGTKSEGELIKALYEICIQIEKPFLSGQINNSCSFVFCAECKGFKIFLNDEKFVLPNSCRDLALCVTSFPQ